MFSAVTAIQLAVLHLAVRFPGQDTRQLIALSVCRPTENKTA
jgi:hypothetical protein